MTERHWTWLAALLLLAAAPLARAAPAQNDDCAPYPTPDKGYVTDLAGLLSHEQEHRIEQWLFDVEKTTGVEIAVVTIRSIRDYPGTANQTIEAFATGLFNAYGIGNMPKNDGVLLLVAERDRKVRIELGAGYGFARDRDAKRIIDRSIVPRFKRDRYADGIERGVKAILREFAGVRVGVNWTLVILGGLIVIGAVVAIDLFRRGKRGWGWVATGIVFILLLVLAQVLVRIFRSTGRSRSGGFGVGGFGGGFGGGFSGGGGATGSW